MGKDKFNIKTEKNSLIIKGYLKTLSHFDEVVKNVKQIKKDSYKSLKIEIHDSFSLNSSFIIYFLELIEDGISIELLVKDKRVYKTLKKLNLIKKLKVNRL